MKAIKMMKSKDNQNNNSQKKAIYKKWKITKNQSKKLNKISQSFYQNYKKNSKKKI